MDKDKASNTMLSEREMGAAKRRHGGGFSGSKSKRTKRRQERIETHAMDKPKPLEVVSDGDLSEVKKDPVWKTWLKEKAGSLPERTEDDIVTDRQGKKDTKRESEQRYEDKLSQKKRRIFSPHKAKDPKAMIATDEQKLRRTETEQAEAQADLVDANRKQAKHSKHVERVRDAKWIEDFRARNTSRKTPSKGKFSIGELGPSGKPPFGTPEHKKIIQETTDDAKREYYKLNPARTKPSKREHKRLFPDQYYASGAKKRKKKSWEVWLDNVTKPIPDSKGGRGSFQHCIDANQDKNNPGGWCKQIERKIGKGLGALGEGKLNRKTGKPMKLKPRKITLDDFEHTNEPSYFNQVMSEEEKKKKEKKKIAEKPESDYYMDAGGNPQRKEKTDYFVEEIRSNIIYHNKILPIMGMIAGQAARGMGKMGKKIGSEVLEGAAEVGQGMLQGVGDEAEEEEQ